MGTISCAASKRGNIMPMRVSWYDAEQTILLCQGEGVWTWDDFHDGNARVVELAKSVDHRVDLIYYRPPGTRPPAGANLKHFRTALDSMPSNVQLHVLVGDDNVLMQTTLNFFFTLYGRFLERDMASRFIMTGSLEKAQTLIMEHRTKHRESVGEAFKARS